MKKKVLLTVGLCAAAFFLLAPAVRHSGDADRPLPPSSSEAAPAIGRLPITFVPNEGQLDEKVVYYERGGGRETFFTVEGAVFLIAGARPVTLSVQGACPDVEIAGEEERAGRINYFIGNDPAAWRTGIPTFGAVRYREVREGIDLRFYGRAQALEYDVIVRPGSDPASVRFSYEGIGSLTLNDDGSLVADLGGKSIVQTRPVVYQEIDGERVYREGAFTILDGEEDTFAYAFEVSSYDRNTPLVIDPVLLFSTYLGGSQDDRGQGIAVDSMGNIYVTGITSSTDFPTAPPLIAEENSGLEDVFVTKFTASGDLVFSTYLGASGSDSGTDIALDGEGDAYITGTTGSEEFPTAPAVTPLQGSLAGLEDAFVAKIDGTGGTLVYSTFLGGTDSEMGYAIDVSTAGMAFVTGITTSADFPTVSPYQGTPQGRDDAFVSKLNAPGTALLYSTYLGGDDNDGGQGIDADDSGNAYVTGYTTSTNFPTAPLSPLQGSLDGSEDAFVTKLDPSGAALVYSTYFGGSDEDFANGIAVTSSGEACIGGRTRSTDLPTVSPLQASHSGGASAEGYVTRLDAAGTSLLFSSYLGGASFENVKDVAVDMKGDMYVVGETGSTDFPTTLALQGTAQGGSNVFVTRIRGNGSHYVYSSYLGGAGSDSGISIAADMAGRAYVTGYTSSDDFPTESFYQEERAGGQDVFVSKILTGSTYSDWNGDGMEDVVWRSYSGAMAGNNHLWYLGITMGSPAVTGTAVLPSVSNSDWIIEGAPDVNGDGTADLLWRNYGTGPDAGSTYVWYMGTTMGMHTMTGGASLPPAGTNWDVEGVPDINGDGMPDLVWRDYSTGANYVWYLGMTMGMPAVTGTAPLPAAGTMWNLDGTPDCDGDGMPDLVWRNYSTGANYVWYLGMTMGMPAVTGGAAIQAAGADWSLDGTPDANLDGKPDLLWRNYTTGANYIWYLGMTMGAPVVTGSDPLSGAAVDWEIEN